ncbi:phosphate ABC transporter permease subunit PstC [uncultured Fenollaria sp.]|uniref:phosphate ABC transporter permease subunit PstC n=1 Tax=uncultured Fenollaria sp. TaxID=1686315 RepID=UPI0025CE8A94|nr:phosphate ABC transporter permease subunit PstC [uncultured Fenollaria sp.]
MNKNFKENFMKYFFFVISLISVFALLLICYFIFSEGIPFVKEYGLKAFLFGKVWAPRNVPASYGIVSMVVGSVYTTLGAIIIGLPIGLLTAIYMAFYSNKKAYKILEPAVQLMAGIPSIVYGFFALVVIVPLVRKSFGGDGMNIITASLLLGIMILPTIISICEASLRAVPKAFFQGSVALGASKEISIFKVVVPAAKSGIISSFILGIGRAIGETMAVYLIAGNQPRIPGSITQGVRTLTTNIVIEMAYATPKHRQGLIATAMVLFIFILVINTIFYFIKGSEKNYE